MPEKKCQSKVQFLSGFEMDPQTSLSFLLHNFEAAPEATDLSVVQV